jgi:hypothetical protein
MTTNLLHVARREIGAIANDGSVWHAFAVASAESDGPSVVLYHAMLGGYDVQTLFLVAPEVLAANSDEHGVMSLAFVRDLLTKDVSDSHVVVRTDKSAGQ